ncbi:MAG: TetR/AcrR family transcriptional regulator [Bacteroidota bacterium]
METKEYIISEADKLFCQFGFKSVTMDDIARQLGISKKTIYQHFADKNDLVNVLMEARFNNHDCDIKMYAKHGHDAVHEVLLGLDDINEWLITLNPKLFFDMQKYHPDTWLKFVQFKEESLAIGITENMKRGIKEGIYRDDIHIPILTELRLAHTQLIFNEYNAYNKNKYSIPQVMKEMTQHFLFGIVTDKGKIVLEKYINEQLIKQ